MIEVTVHVPLADNNGAAFDAASYDAFHAFLASTFGGFSKLFGTVAGGWIDPKTAAYYADSHFAYVVALNSITEGGKVATLADTVKAQFGQINVYVSYLNLSEIL